MPDQRTLTVAEQEDQEDAEILRLLSDEDGQRPWSVDEIALQLDSNVTDHLNRLHGYGLIHRLDKFAWATRAALVADRLRN